LNQERILSLQFTAGVVLVFLSLLLPWGVAWLPPHRAGWSQTLLGVELSFGKFALVGNVISAVALIFYRRKSRKYALVLAFLGQLAVSFFSLTWIANHDKPSWPWEAGRGIAYEALYGAYICLIGSVTTLATVILRVLNRRTVQIESQPQNNLTPSLEK